MSFYSTVMRTVQRTAVFQFCARGWWVVSCRTTI